MGCADRVSKPAEGAAITSCGAERSGKGAVQTVSWNGFNKGIREELRKLQVHVNKEKTKQLNLITGKIADIVWSMYCEDILDLMNLALYKIKHIRSAPIGVIQEYYYRSSFKFLQF